MSQDTVRDAFDSFFRFKIGDLVVPRALLESYRAAIVGNPPFKSYERHAVPQGAVVVERRLVQCHGGIQGFYCLSQLDGTSPPVVECELAAWEELVEVAQGAPREPENAWRDRVSTAPPPMTPP